LPILPTISTGLIVLSAILIAIGWVLIVKDKPKAHKKVMISAAVSALLFFVIYMSRTVFMGNTSFGGPENLEIYYTIFLIFHIVLATVGAIFGLVTLTLAFKRKINKHRKWGPITSVTWFFTAITGVIVYLLLYVFFDGGTTTSMLKAIFGF
jgi:putative membrane protein